MSLAVPYCTELNASTINLVFMMKVLVYKEKKDTLTYLTQKDTSDKD